MILKGKVVKGLGRAKIFVNMMENIFYKKTGIKLYHGTLNVKLDILYDLNADYIIKSEDYGGTFNVQVQKCKVFQHRAYIVRSEKNLNDKRDYSQDIIEIVSNVNFREKYNLRDGDIIEIEIREKEG